MSRKRDPLEFFDQNGGQDPQLTLDKCLVDCCREGDIDTVIDLLQKGASVEAKTYTDRQALSGENFITPLMGAVSADKQQLKIAKLLLENGADVNAGDVSRLTPLHVAAANGHRDCVRLFLDNGASVNVGTLDQSGRGASRAGTTPLHLAAGADKEACVEELITHGLADYNRRDTMGYTCLNWACQSAGETCILTLLRLIERPAVFMTCPPRKGNTPLHDCVCRDLTNCARELLLRGVDANKVNLGGQTPLHLATIPSQSCSSEMIKTLLTYGRGIEVDNTSGAAGLNPLERVAFRMQALHELHSPAFSTESAVHLIAHGANVHIQYRGQSLLEHELFRPDGDPRTLTAIVRASSTFRLSETTVNLSADDVGAEAWKKLKWLRGLLSSPRSLQHCSRIAIRRIMGPGKMNRLQELLLPPSLQDFLLLKS